MQKYTAPKSTLDKNEVFVFGSNLDGFHGAGAAGYASFGEFGNVWRKYNYDNRPNGWKGRWNIKGVAEGFQEGTRGKSYAIPTVTKAGKKRSIPLKDIEASIMKLLLFVDNNPHLSFFIAQGAKMGFNGYTPEEMASAYWPLSFCDNVFFEEDFYLEIAKYQEKADKTYTQEYPIVCFRCEKQLTRCRLGGTMGFDNPPEDATYWRTMGNYGSAVFDGGEFTKSYLELYICDDCLKSKQNRVYHINKENNIRVFDSNRVLTNLMKDT